jgi:dTDP-4-amino-4,6-dideoxyglucose
MSEVSAAMAITSLEVIEEITAVNQERYELYRELLSPLPGVTVHEPPPTERNNYQYVVLEIDPEQAGITRDGVHRFLLAENVHAKPYFHPGCHRMAPYVPAGDTVLRPLPRTDRLSDTVLALPTGYAISLDEVRTVCSLIELAVTWSWRRETFH